MAQGHTEKDRDDQMAARAERLQAVLEASRIKMITAQARVQRALETAQQQAALLPLHAQLEKLKDAVGAGEQVQAAMHNTLAAKDRYIAQFAHEVRQALQGCMNASSVLRIRSSGKTTRAVDTLDRQLKRIAHLTDDVLLALRGSLGRIELHRRVFPVTNVVDAALETAAPEIRARRHAVLVAVDRTLKIDADEVRLEQVFANLLVNAAKFTDPGGEIVVTGAADGNAVAIVVRDNGRGLTKTELDSIFEPFTSSDRSPGLGMGLAIASDLVKLHGGTLMARSEGPGRGSEFTVRLPLAAA